MSAIRSKDTEAELLLRALLSAFGYRYRLHGKHLPGKPDLYFPKQKIAIFCDGDFWHGRGWTKKKREQYFRVRRHYWIKKMDGNIARDKQNNRDLKKMGWEVLRFWESDLKIDPFIAIEAISKLLKSTHAK